MKMLKKKVVCNIVAVIAAVAAAAPEFKVGSVENPTAIHIQRTMKALEESTAEKPATVRVLFYGQSIVRQGWTDVLMKMLREKYPTVNFVWANKAIGGFTSPALTRTAWSDLFPYYPDADLGRDRPVVQPPQQGAGSEEDARRTRSAYEGHQGRRGAQ